MAVRGGFAMSDLIWLSEAQMRRIEPYFPLSHGVPRVDDRRIISGIIFVIRNGLRWRDTPAAYGPPKTIYNRFIRWSRMGRQRHKVGNMFGKLKDWRRIHTRYDRCAHTFMSAICIAATVIFWLNQ
jgi:transposase